jgi:non-specific serine/threonine protein kinase/serine/threonine-protein kinase
MTDREPSRSDEEPAETAERSRDRIPQLSLSPGERVGAYRIIEPLGSGGFGEVYLAERREPRQRVALKILKRGMDTVQVVARFDAEREALALMDHQNVAKVLDAGATTAGRPYFVMEYVPGVSITEYCDLNELPIRERLALFIQACSGVQHAHSRGIIHRDIKPQNVLVTIKEGQPLVKVIDFGIAKAVSRQLAEESIHTMIGEIMGSLDYMSPEQAEMSGLDIDIRTDVYSLGILLYQLLVGTLPHDSTRLQRAAYAEVVRILRHEAAPNPSTRLSTLGEAVQQSAERRHTTPRLLIQELRGDLDWITMTAIEKDRTRRYETAHDLAKDIQRYLRNEPVVARPPSVVYKVGKFVRRNRALSAAVVAMTAIVALGAGGTVIGWLEAARAAEEARRGEATASASVTLLEDLVAAADPWDEHDRDLTLRAALERAAARLRARQAADPLVTARLGALLGGWLASLGEYGAADALLIAAHETLADAYGPEDPRTTDAQRKRGILAGRRGRSEEAESILRNVLDAQRRTAGDDSPETAETLTALGVLCYSYLRKADEAEPMLRRALSARRSRMGPGDVGALTTQVHLANLLTNQSRFDEAGRLYEEARAAAEELGAEDRLEILSAVASFLFMTRRFDEAERLFVRLVEEYEAVAPAGHPDLFIAQANLGVVYMQRGRYDDAARLNDAARAGLERSLGEAHPDTLNTYYQSALTRQRAGDRDGAERLYVAALEICRRRLGPAHELTLRYLDYLAAFLRTGERWDELAAIYAEALAGRRATSGPEAVETLLASMRLVHLEATRMGRASEARAELERCLGAARAQLPSESERLAPFLAMHADGMIELREFDRAERALEEILSIANRTGDADARRRAVAGFVRLYERWGRAQDAAQWRREMEAPAPSPAAAAHPDEGGDR